MSPDRISRRISGRKPLLLLPLARCCFVLFLSLSLCRVVVVVVVDVG